MAEQNTSRRPRPLPPGGTVGIVSPSSPVEQERLEPGIAVLRERGFQVRLAPHALDRYGHKAGQDNDRAADLAAFYADPTIDALWCARGGSSACRVWPHLDWDTVKALPPKMLIGFSDITSLHVPFGQRLGVVSLHGPMIVHLGLEPPDVLDWLFQLLQSDEPAGLVPGHAQETLVSGTAQGELRGGCLSLLAATLGTPCQFDPADGILFLEDVDETPPRIERFLFQLREAGVLDCVAGFVVGEATDADDAETVPMRGIWADLLVPFGKPAVLGFPAGHVSPNYALPLGLPARLDADARTLELLAPAVQ